MYVVSRRVLTDSFRSDRTISFSISITIILLVPLALHLHLLLLCYASVGSTTRQVCHITQQSYLPRWVGPPTAHHLKHNCLGFCRLFELIAICIELNDRLRMAFQGSLSRWATTLQHHLHWQCVLHLLRECWVMDTLSAHLCDMSI